MIFTTTTCVLKGRFRAKAEILGVSKVGEQVAREIHNVCLLLLREVIQRMVDATPPWLVGRQLLGPVIGEDGKERKKEEK